MPDNIGRRAAMFLFSRSAVSNQSEGYIEIISEFSIRSDTKIILLSEYSPDRSAATAPREEMMGVRLTCNSLSFPQA